MLKYRTVYQCLSRAKQRDSYYSQVKPKRWTASISASKEIYFDDASLAAAKSFEEIPHFRMLPILGTAWIYLPIIGYYDLRKQDVALKDKRRRLGKIFREKAGSLNLVLSCNADDGEIMFRNEGPYPSRPALETMKVYRESRKQWYSSIGLGLSEGKEWDDLRKKVQKHLMKPRAVQAYLNPIQDVARDLVDKIYKTRDANGEVPEFFVELNKWALESIAFVGLDARLGCLKSDLSEDSDGKKMINAVQSVFDLMYKLEPIVGNIPFWKYISTPMWKKYAAAADTASEISFKHINRALEELKKESSEDKDLTLLQSMLMAKGLDVSDVMVTVADMMMAGIDTTSHTVGFFLYHMARNPQKQELLHQEIKNLLPRKEDRITTAVFSELRYLKACMKESQRLLPIVSASARIMDHDIILSGYRIPAGTILILALLEMYQDEMYYSKPEQYLPERWLNKDDKFHPFAFLPFGFGTRSCVGRRLAELEMICVITEIIRNFRIEYHYEDIGVITRLINTPDKPLRCKFIER